MPRKTTPKVSPLRGMPVADWVRSRAKGWQAAVVRRLIEIGRKAAPEATLSIKWGQPVFEQNGPFAFIKVAREHVTFGFWRGAELDDPGTVLEGGAQMKHLKILNAAGVDEARLAAFVRQAVELNRTKGDPTKRSA